jgi:hypothetical protein
LLNSGNRLLSTAIFSPFIIEFIDGIGEATNVSPVKPYTWFNAVSGGFIKILSAIRSDLGQKMV